MPNSRNVGQAFLRISLYMVQIILTHHRKVDFSSIELGSWVPFRAQFVPPPVTLYQSVAALSRSPLPPPLSPPPFDLRAKYLPSVDRSINSLQSTSTPIRRTSNFHPLTFPPFVRCPISSHSLRVTSCHLLPRPHLFCFDSNKMT